MNNEKNGMECGRDGVAWSLIDDYDDELPTLEIDPDGDLTSWGEARDALIDALMGVVSDAESRLEEAQDWEQEANEELSRVEGMDQKAFLATYGPEEEVISAKSEADTGRITTAESLPGDDDLIKELMDMGSDTLASGYMARTDALAEIIDHLEFMKPDAWRTVRELHQRLLGDGLVGAKYDDERDAFALKDSEPVTAAKMQQPAETQMTPDEAIQALPGEETFNQEALQAYECFITAIEGATVRAIARVGRIPMDLMEAWARNPKTNGLFNSWVRKHTGIPLFATTEAVIADA